MRKKVKNFFFAQINHEQNYRGIFEITLSCFLLSIVVALVRHLNQNFHIFFIVMMRNFFGLIFLLPQFIKNRGTIFQTKNIYLHVFRGGNGTISMFFWFYAVNSLPLSEAVSLSFLTPIVTTIASMIFLKEKVSKNIFLASFISFIGVIIILRPGFHKFDEGYIFSFCSIIFWTISNLIVKTMTKTDKPQTIVAHMTFFMFIFSMPFALPYLAPLNFTAFIEFFILGIISNMSYKLIAEAYSKNDLSILQPFDFSRLIFTSLVAYFIFDEKLDIWVFVGSLIILFGLILIVKKKSTKSQKKLVQNANEL
jgi:drug/metabolite transporter (DMT)-like permease